MRKDQFQYVGCGDELGTQLNDQIEGFVFSCYVGLRSCKVLLITCCTEYRKFVKREKKNPTNNKTQKQKPFIVQDVI